MVAKKYVAKCGICGKEADQFVGRQDKTTTYRMPICDECDQELYEHYKEIVEDNREPINPHEAYD